MKRSEPTGSGRRSGTGPSDPPEHPTGSGRPERAHPPGADRSPTATIPVRRDEPPEHLFRRLLGAYLAGAREFLLRERPVVSNRTRDVVRTFCRRTRQPEIISDEPGMLRLRDLAYESPVPLAQRVGRMGRMVVEFHRDAVESWSHVPFGEDGQWERRDDEIDREAWYLQRLAAIQIEAGTDGTRVLGPWTVARSLERIADHAAILAEAGRRLVDLPNGSTTVVSLRQFHAQAMEHLEGVLASADEGTANDLLDMGEALAKSGQSIADRLLPTVSGVTMPPATAAAVARILESIGRTIAYSQDIAQVVLDRALPVALVAERPDPGRVSLPAAP
jgi:PhoU domain